MKLYNVKFYGNLGVYADSEAEARERFFESVLELVQATEIDEVQILEDPAL